VQAYRKRASTLVALAAIGAASATLATAGTASAGRSGPTLSVSRAHDVGHLQTATPIKHLVVIFDENVSFDHYFATYPVAANPTGEPQFTAAKSTPDVNGLTSALLNANTNASNPARLDRSDALTCDQDHGYTDEQLAVDAGAMDQVVARTGKGATLAQCLAGLNEPVPGNASSNYAVMDYYDGNTVTAMWNYAQHFAMSDNSYGTTYGPSTPGALNVTAANTYGAICGPSSATINDSACSAPSSTTTFDPTTLTTVGAQTTAGAGTDYSDADPYYDVCSYLQDKNTPASTIQMGGPNIGTALDAKNLTWGWFQGGFDNGYVPGQGTTPPTTAQICAESHKNLGGATVSDYSPHHEPFEYYASTANPQHLPPTSVAMIGHQDQANHQYDIADFWAAANQGNMPAVSYLKAPAYQDGHAGYSDPLDEQAWLTGTINHLESLPSWRSTAVVISYDDSDGWYDHVASPVLTQSQSPIDALTGTGTCGTNTAAVPRTTAGTPEQGKCGLGPRLPFLVISPYAKKDYVSSSITDQSSVVNFIEFNWNTGALGNGAADTTAGSILPMFDFDAPSASKLFLDATTGEPVQQ
jgi:phospholipase C